MSTNIKKNGIVETSSFSNFISNPLDTKWYVEPDGSTWIRLAHHNNPTNYLFTNGQSFATTVYIDENRWFNVALCNKVEISKWELMVKQKGLSTDTEQKYRWIQNYNPILATYDQTVSANVTKITTSGYTTSSYGGIYYKNSSTYLASNNANSGNWWGAFGSWTAYEGGIPGFNTVVIKSGYMDLYLRIDNDPKSSCSIFNNTVIARDFIEI